MATISKEEFVGKLKDPDYEYWQRVRRFCKAVIDKGHAVDYQFTMGNPAFVVVRVAVSGPPYGIHCGAYDELVDIAHEVFNKELSHISTQGDIISIYLCFP